MALFELLFQHVYHRNIQLSVHQQYIVAFVLCSINVCILFVEVVGIQINQTTVLICLIVFNQSLIFFESIIFAVCIFEQGELICFLVEIFLSKHTVIDENLQVIPFVFKLFTVVLEDRLQTVCHFLGDVCRNLFYIRITLQVRT